MIVQLRCENERTGQRGGKQQRNVVRLRNTDEVVDIIHRDAFWALL